MSLMLVSPQVLVRPSGVAVRTVEVQLTRDGEQTSSAKAALLLNRSLQIAAVFVGSYSITQRFSASAVDAGWLIVALDETPAARAGARYVLIDSDVTVAIDLNDGSGGGGGGQPATVAARVRLAQQPVSRPLVVVGRAADGVWQVLGSGQSDAAGNAALELRVPPSVAAYAVAIDNWGVPFQAGLAVDDGVVVRPTQFAGWLYQVTEAGTLPASEPVWWPAEGDNAPRQLGTARAVAVRYYQPLAHGPVPVEVL